MFFSLPGGSSAGILFQVMQNLFVSGSASAFFLHPKRFESAIMFYLRFLIVKRSFRLQLYCNIDDYIKKVRTFLLPGY